MGVVLSALVMHGKTDDSGLDPDAVRRALDQLERGGLAVQAGDGWQVRRERFRELLHATAKPVVPVWAEDRVESAVVPATMGPWPVMRRFH
ncbi:MAG: hypothetical protein JWQ95_4613 [Sphaerisporangium sp.]|nr:hypothetical protein [Sphaerisporangium sp.]